jgi:pantoate--beta-alanine ligase
MERVYTVAAVRGVVGDWRSEGAGVALVPTMGNLHRGHLRLVERARELADRTVVTIFVNPLQFGAGEDFDAYPRTLEADERLLADAGADLVYAPGGGQMYRRPPEEQTQVEVPGVSDILCGASRPGHFSGVATVVCKLLNQVNPDVAVFGMKDFQQLLVIRRMVDDLDIPVDIVGYPVVRDTDGLALSSRNGYLTPRERAVAPELVASLEAIEKAILDGRRDYPRLEQEAGERLARAGFRADYVSVRRAGDLQRPEIDDRELVVLAAAYLGKARLIDNIMLVL